MQESDVIVEGDDIKIVEREVVLHRLPKVLSRQIKSFKLRWFHFVTLALLPFSPWSRQYINKYFEPFLCDLADRLFPRASQVHGIRASGLLLRRFPFLCETMCERPKELLPSGGSEKS